MYDHYLNLFIYLLFKSFLMSNFPLILMELSPLRLSMRTLLTSTLWLTTCIETWWLTVRTSVSSSGKTVITQWTFYLHIILCILYTYLPNEMWQLNAKQCKIAFSFCSFTSLLSAISEPRFQDGREAETWDNNLYSVICDLLPSCCGSW